MRLFAAIFSVLFGITAGFIAWARGAPARQLAALERDAHIEPLDVVFQDLDCGPRHTHVGIVLLENGERLVWEADGAVTATPLADWVARTRGNVSVYRFDEEMLTSADDIAREIRNLKHHRLTSAELITSAIKRATATTLTAPEPSPDDLAESPHLRLLVQK
ncbi:MAG: hypothetical protein JNK82_29570 [Myxococcaceae bacterium]|nr:hypothetical protein [Myxococcaceae bacterium]